MFGSKYKPGTQTLAFTNTQSLFIHKCYLVLPDRPIVNTDCIYQGIYLTSYVNTPRVQTRLSLHALPPSVMPWHSSSGERYFQWLRGKEMNFLHPRTANIFHVTFFQFCHSCGPLCGLAAQEEQQPWRIVTSSGILFTWRGAKNMNGAKELLL